jgi:hypothetical protein
MVLPMAQYKGYAIAAMMDVLSGVVTGSGFGTGVYGRYQTAHRSGAGQFMIALNIAAFQPLAEFNARMDALIAELKSVPLAPLIRRPEPRRVDRRTAPRAASGATSAHLRGHAPEARYGGAAMRWERIDVGPEGMDIRLRTEGLAGLVRDLGAVSPEALPAAA